MLVAPEVTYILYFPWSWKALSTVLPQNSLEAVAATTKFTVHNILYINQSRDFQFMVQYKELEMQRMVCTGVFNKISCNCYRGLSVAVVLGR